MGRASGLKGSFPLTKESIEKEVKRIEPGVFALGVMNERRFQMLLVGRSDSNLAKTLKTYVGKANCFKYETYLEPEHAFRKECELFHFFKPRANQFHPRRSKGTDWVCPDCGQY